MLNIKLSIRLILFWQIGQSKKPRTQPLFCPALNFRPAALDAIEMWLKNGLMPRPSAGTKKVCPGQKLICPGQNHFCPSQNLLSEVKKS